jgi:inner membrane protein
MSEPRSSFSPHLIRILALAALVVVAQFPIWMIDSLVRERQQRRDAALEDVASKWGRQQSLAGPLLVVPYLTHRTEKEKDGKEVQVSDGHLATFLPEHLTVRGQLEVEQRRRGIFSIPVYRTNLDVQGSFNRPSFSEWGIPDEDVRWDRAQVAFGVSDIRALEAPTAIQWNDMAAELKPGPGDGVPLESGVHAAVTIPAGEQTILFQVPLRLQGSSGIYWTPLGKSTHVSLSSNWSHPSFQGNWLPERHTESDHGFQADWTVPYLGRNFPPAWRDAAVRSSAFQGARFGVDLVQAVDHYQMAARSVKYAALFLLLTFATLWLVEVLAGIRVHPIQYLMMGGAICVFYLLELSLSEHLGFLLSYAIATTAIVAQITAYGRAVLRSARRAAIVGGMVTALYVYLYVVLTNEDYALLIGSIGVFVLLATIMRLTRRVDWYGTGAPSEARGKAAQVFAAQGKHTPTDAARARTSSGFERALARRPGDRQQEGGGHGEPEHRAERGGCGGGAGVIQRGHVVEWTHVPEQQVEHLEQLASSGERAGGHGERGDESGADDQRQRRRRLSHDQRAHDHGNHQEERQRGARQPASGERPSQRTRRREEQRGGAVPALARAELGPH